MPLTIEERVAAGAEFLDEAVPGWELKINLEKLDLGSCDVCMIGQLFQDFGAGIVGLFGDRWIVPAQVFGFMAFHTAKPEEYDALDVEWTRVIKERLDAGIDLT